MKQRWIKIAAVWWGMLVVLAVVVSRETWIDRRFNLLSENYSALLQKADALAKRGDELDSEVSKLKQRDEQVRKQRAAQPKSRHELAAEFQARASDLQDFGNERELNRPRTIVSAFPDVTRQNSEDRDRYNAELIRVFIKQFSGPLRRLVREARAYRLDTSRLQRHLATFDAPIVMRLIVSDLYDLADQLEPPVTRQPPPAPQPRIEPPVRSTAAGGQE